MILREPNYLATTPTYWPRGVECVLDYDNSACVMNDLRRMDRIVVTSIGGLSGPDLNTTAEKRPDRDGEDAQDATYGGRTITLTGYIEAGNLDKLRATYSYLLDAFDDPVEAPLWFRYLDWRDLFIDSLALVDYAYDAGTGTVQVASDGTGLQPTSTANKILRVLPTKSDGTSPSRFTYGDGEAILRFRNGTAMTGAAVGVEFRRSSSVRKLRVIYEKATDTLRLYKVDTATTQLATVAATTLAIGTDYWIRVRAEGSLITFSLWSTYPPDVGTTGQLATQTSTLSGGDLALYPASTSGLGWGLYWTPNSTTDRVKLLDVGAINPGDAIINCRKATVIEGNEAQVDYQWRREFMLTLRASDSRMVSRKATKVTLTPPGTPVSQLYYSATLTNYGRSPASLIVRFNGNSINPHIYVPSQGKVLAVTSPIGTLSGWAAETWLELDTTTRTVINNFSDSKYSLLSDDSTWPELLPGSNEFRIISNKIEDFNGTPGAVLNARTSGPSSLGAWTTLGATTDFVINTLQYNTTLPALSVSRTTTSDTGNGRIGFLATNNYTDARIDLPFRFTTAFSTTNAVRMGIIARYVNSTNYLMVTAFRSTSGGDLTYYIKAYKVIAGVNTEIQSLQLTYPTYLQINTWYTLSLQMRSNGRLDLMLSDPITGSLITSTGTIFGGLYRGDIDTALTWATVDSALATGGALATGKIGIVDYNSSVTAITRYLGPLYVTSAIDSGTIDVTYRNSSR